MTTTVLRAERVLTEDGDANAVSIRDETIAEVGRFEELTVRTADTVVDVGELTISPGFVDTHVHITGNGLPSAPAVIQQEPPELLLLRAADNSRRALAEGVTTMRDCGARNDVIFRFRDAANRDVVAAPNILATGGSLTRTGGHGHWWQVEADTPDEARKAVRRQSKEGADSLKVMVDGGIDLGRTAPGLLYFDAEELGLVVRDAKNWGLDVAAHCLTAAGVRAAVSAGVTSIEHGIFYEHDLDDTRYDPAVGEQMVAQGTYLAPGPGFAYDVFTDPEAETTFPRNARLFHRRLQDTAEMYQQGVKVVAGTDAGWYATPFGQYARCPELLVQGSGLSPQDAFDACTRLAAESLGLAETTGTIRPGHRADLVIVDGDPRADASAFRRIRTTIVRGRVLFDTGLFINHRS